MEPSGPRPAEPHPLVALVGEAVWHVSAGGVTWPEFVLVLGGELPREVRLRNARQPARFRRSHGTHELLVACGWTLLVQDEALADATSARAHARSIRGLRGARVVAVDVASNDGVELRFDDGRRLVVCPGSEPVPMLGAPAWEAWLPCGEVAARPRAPTSPSC